VGLRTRGQPSGGVLIVPPVPASAPSGPPLRRRRAFATCAGMAPAPRTLQTQTRAAPARAGWFCRGEAARPTPCGGTRTGSRAGCAAELARRELRCTARQFGSGVVVRRAGESAWAELTDAVRGDSGDSGGERFWLVIVDADGSVTAWPDHRDPAVPVRKERTPVGDSRQPAEAGRRYGGCRDGLSGGVSSGPGREGRLPVPGDQLLGPCPGTGGIGRPGPGAG
jgi:hypothetical protein